MAENFFSDHFNNNATPGVTTLAGSLTYDAQRRADASVNHARLRVKRAIMTVGTGAVIDSQLRMFQMKSGDRLFELFLTSNGGATAGAVDIGLYESGLKHDGTEIDDNLFASAVAISSAIARVDEFEEATTLDEGDRGKPLWELADIGGGTYSVDPLEDWDLVMTVTTAFTVALTDLILEAVYTAGD